MRLRYEDYAKCVSEHHEIRVKALLEPLTGLNEPTMTIVDIPLSTPTLLVQVGTLQRSHSDHEGKDRFGRLGLSTQKAHD